MRKAKDGASTISISMVSQLHRLSAKENPIHNINWQGIGRINGFQSWILKKRKTCDKPKAGGVQYIVIYQNFNKDSD